MLASAEKVSVPASNSKPVNFVAIAVALCVVVSVALAFKLRTDPKKPTRDAVLRVLSPDSSELAVVYEQPGDAKTSFLYQVEVTAENRTQTVAEFAGAMRNDRAYGVNLRWSGDNLLSIDYFTAQQEKLVTPDANFAGRKVHVVLHRGVRDDDALPGGMLFNLLQRL